MKSWFDFAPVEYHFPELKNLQVNAIEQDSRKVKPNAAFFAVPGELADGRKYIESAIKNGASIVVAEADLPSFSEKDNVFFLGIPNLKDNLGYWASAFYGAPSRQMTVIAVTGTNGKTSCTQLIAGALQQLGLPCGVMGTLGNGIYGQLIPSPNTTPDAFVMQAEFAKWREKGVRYAAIEASSHGLVLGRMQNTHIHTAAITNITRDHLDFHETMENYIAAKKQLFHWPDIKAAVINIDDPECEPFTRILQKDVLLYTTGIATQASVRARSVQLTTAGLVLQIDTSQGEAQINSQLYGRFNVENLLIATGCLLSIGIPLDDAVVALAKVKPVPGRMQKVQTGEPNQPDVIVDYAHTPDALEKLLLTAREHCHGRLWCVFGCGGDRDPGKRPQMAALAERLADHCVVANDNPRTESPEAIVNDILAGFQAPSAVDVILDRKAAIEFAIRHAKPGDVVLLAGKGHETYQEVNHVRTPFSDVEVALHALSQYSVKLC